MGGVQGGTGAPREQRVEGRAGSCDIPGMEKRAGPEGACKPFIKPEQARDGGEWWSGSWLVRKLAGL